LKKLLETWFLIQTIEKKTEYNETIFGFIDPIYIPSCNVSTDQPLLRGARVQDLLEK
jgi:hypothetical protein